MVKIAFWDNYLCERGSSIAVFDYAYYNIHLLKNESIIFYNKSLGGNKENVIEKFRKHFEVIGVNHFNEVDEYLTQYKCEMIYIIKYGPPDGQLSKCAINLVHANFICNQPHGERYAAVTPWLAGNNGNIPVVPHMINLPEVTTNMRAQLNIPEDAVVFGRHGGKGEFDNPNVHKIVYEVAKNNPSIYFLFLNTNEFCDTLPNIIHIPETVDLNKKVEFINSCDAMLWARCRGETFGLSIGEFSSKNKPVICRITNHEDAHIHLLGSKGIIYNEETLYTILVNFDRKEMAEKDWNAYRDYEPAKVMEIFKNVFLCN